MQTFIEPLVVLGVVLDSHNRVLLVRRCGASRWIFPGGQSEPGEAEAETVVREVREETGVECLALHCIGRRIHPESHRELSYWLCKGQSDLVMVRDKTEIAEARWVQPDEALDLLGGTLYGPARKILAASCRGDEIDSPRGRQ